MALDLYLVVVTAGNTQLAGTPAPKNLKNPLRNGAAVTRPLAVDDVSFGVDAPLAVSGDRYTPGRPDPSELTVTLPDDSATSALFRTIAGGSRLDSVDVLAVTAGDSPRVISATGITTAYLTGLTRTVTADGVVLKLSFDGQEFLVGSALQRPDLSYAAFTFVTYDSLAGRVE